jgi:hypothetical protein
MIAALRTADGLSKAVIFLSLVLVVLAYLPTLQFDYVTQDQWRAFRYSTEPQSALERGQACIDLIPKFYVLTGRPFVWMTECIEHAAVARIADFAQLRPIVLAIVLATVMCLGFVLAPILGGLAFGVLAAAAMVLTPAYSFMYLQGMPAAMVLIAPILAAASYKLYSQRKRGAGGKLKKAAISFCLFVTACLIYPAYAFVVLPLALLEFGFDLSETLSNRLKNLVSTLSFYFGASLFYYVLVKVTVSFVERTAGDVPNGYDVAMQLGPSALLQQAKAAAAYFLYMPPFDFSSPVALSVVILVAFSGYLGWLTCRARAQGGSSIFTIGLLFLIVSVVLLFASISPWLFSQTQGVAARHVLTWNLFFCAASVGLLSLLLRRYQATARLASAILLLGGLLPMAWIENRQSKLETVVTGTEIQLMRDRLSNWIDMKGWINNRYLLVVLPTRPRPPNIEQAVNPRYGNGNAVLASSKNPVSIPWMVNALLRERADYPGVQVAECGYDQACANYWLLNSKKVVVSYASGAELIQSAVEPYVINFSSLNAKTVTPSVAVVKINASSVLDDLGPGGLLWSMQPGWHASRNPTYPQTITVDFIKPRSFSTVSFEPQDGFPLRMPKEVKIGISDDGNEWTPIASASDVCALDDPGGSRSVKTSEPVQARFLQVEILSNCGDPDILTLKGLKVE